MIGVFDCSGLPEYARGSWANACKIVKEEKVRPHLSSSTYYMVGSLTSTAIYDVSTEHWSCPCDRYKQFRLCAHVLAVAAVTGRMVSFLGSWEEPTIDRAVTTVKLAGKKPGAPRKRPAPSKRVEFDRAMFVPPPSAPPPAPEKEVLFVWLRDNPRVRVCYGCKGFIRPSPGVIPDEPWDLVVRKTIFRTYLRDGTVCMNVKKTPAYFHLRDRCCMVAGGEIKQDNFGIEKPFLLNRAHKTRIMQEFNIQA